MSDPVVLLSTGDVVGPAGGVTDNSMVLFSGTSGKLIKGNNAVVTAAGLALLDDVSAAAQMVTLGLTATATELNYTDGVTSSIQTQLDGKAASSHTHSYLPLYGGTMTGAITHGDAAAVQTVTDSWKKNGVTIWNMGREADGDFKLWSYTDEGAYSNEFTFKRDGGFVVPGHLVTHGQVSAATMTLSGRATVGDSLNSGWYRSTNAQGWYNETYGGGIHMQDATYVRTYNNKQFLCNDVMRVEGLNPQVQLWDSDHGILRYLYAGAGSIGFLNNSGNWTLQNDDAGNTINTGNLTVNGVIYGNGSGLTNLLGQGQTWQSVTASRALGITYTNTTGRPIMVAVTVRALETGVARMDIGGVTVATVIDHSLGSSNTIEASASFVVPNGASYALAVAAGTPTLVNWSELR